ncbi:MAG TPA: SusC/RagA family TonB-linked outer membrane protein, partial [Bacteroidales bacterium]|nr:SusC/RagA family TonB-linked outer membrane protein [Bacteroidales bacterium]
STIINAGQIDNRGIELSVNGIPVKTRSGFEWSMGLNFSRNVNKVSKLAQGLDHYVLGGYWSLDVLAVPGEPFGVLYGYDFMRNDEGKVIHIDGLPVQGDIKNLGNYTPDWVAGLTNSIRYKNLLFSVLIDARWGGEIYSMTNTWGRYAGVLGETLIGREGGLVGVGVMDDGQGRWVENDVVVSAEEYNKAAYNNNIAYSSIFDASFVKLREVQVGYTFPKIGKNVLRDVSISLVGRNLALLYARVPHIDPETAFSSSNVQGLEFGQHPTARSFGINLTFRF